MRIFIPFTHLRSETLTACVDATLVALKDKEWGYADYWITRWQDGEKFINVEQDVVPMSGVLEEMWNCREPYCKTDYCYPFAGSRIDVSPVGCAKFSSEFIAAHPAIFTRHLHWHEPQHIIINASLNKAHVHGPPSLHLHVGEDWPLDARRKYATP